SVKLNLHMFRQYEIDSTVNNINSLSLSVLKGVGVENWSENDSDFTNFSIENFTVEKIGDSTFCEKDTMSIKIPVDLLTYWADTSNTNYGLVIQQVDTTQQNIQSIYSSEAAYPSWLEIKYELKNDTTVYTKSIIASEDLTIMEYFDNPINEENLVISYGRACRVFLKFSVEDSIKDKNITIAKASLKFHIDQANTVMYNESFYLYLNALKDSSEYNDPFVDYSNVNFDAYCDVSASDTLITFEINHEIQGITSGYVGNYGFLIRSSSKNIDIAKLSLFSSSEMNAYSKRPYLEILTMKEQ
ncbi:DNRLRE domain-containing protein, partial [bacterium]|nr:DNRLRE domain-containing protein [bacterium]